MSRVYQRLLEEWRSAYQEYHHIGLVVEVFAPSSFSSADPPYDRDEYELLAPVGLPLDATKPLLPDQRNSTMFGWAVVKENKTTLQALDKLRQLCSESGLYLPPAVRDSVAGLCPSGMDAPASWWIALLLLHGGRSAYSSDGQFEGYASLTRPFLRSVDLIERIGLDTDDARPPDEEIAEEDSHATPATQRKPIVSENSSERDPQDAAEDRLSVSPLKESNEYSVAEDEVRQCHENPAGNAEKKRPRKSNPPRKTKRQGRRGVTPVDRFAEIESLYHHERGEKQLAPKKYRERKKRAHNWLSRDWNKNRADGSKWWDSLDEEHQIKLAQMRDELQQKWETTRQKKSQ